LTNNKSIKHLSLSFCGLSNHAGIKIAQSLRNNNTLETLNLSGNKFNLKTLHEIADSLLLNKKFKKFILEHNTYDAMEVEKKSSKKSYILFMRKLLKINNK
jgi:Ran GTPase-activating protein (RanGAP) involved in mRNA processing and transport